MMNLVQRPGIFEAFPWRVLFVAALFVLCGQPGALAAQQEGEETHEAEEHHGFANGVSLFLGAATHARSEEHDRETGFAIGLEYARSVASALKLGLLGEYSSAGHEQTYVLAVPLFAHVAKGLVLVAAPGMEYASFEEEGHEETETEFFMRLGAIYEFEVGNWALGPQVHADHVGEKWTLVYGLGIGIGF